jgi:hypothetical protein
LEKPTPGQTETTTPGQIFNREEGRVGWRKWRTEKMGVQRKEKKKKHLKRAD